MAERFKFTKEKLDALRVPAGKDRITVHDAEGRHLVLTARGGVKTFYVYRRGPAPDYRPLRVMLGRYPTMTINQARDAADEVNDKINKGGNPSAAKREARASMTLAELFEHYVNTHAKAHKKTWQADRGTFHRYFGKPDVEREPEEPAPPFPGWRTRRVNTIAHEHVRDLHARVGVNHGHYAANRLLALLSTMFNNARLANPTEGVRRFRETERDRFLAPDELPRFFKALQDEPNPTIRDFVLILILVGARRGNAQSMAWADVNLEAGTWRIPMTKGGDPLTVHLPPAAVAILAKRRAEASPGEPWVFPGTGKTGHLVKPEPGWTGILKRAGIADLRMHDLRRTLGSWQAAGGASLLIIGKSLGHRNQRTTQIYARLNLSPVAQSVNAATAAMTVHMPAGLLPAPPDENPRQSNAGAPKGDGKGKRRSAG